MKSPLKLSSGSHIVDVLGNVKGRDQPIMLMDRALDLASMLEDNSFIDSETVFFDPFCKAGEILLACALLSVWSKLNEGIMNADVSSVENEMYNSNRFFAMAPDERHYRLSLRTFLGNEKSHQSNYTKNFIDGHYLSEIDGRLDKDKFKKEFDSMLEYIVKNAGQRKIIAVGNPPYQESDGGFGKSAINIYQEFVTALYSNPKISKILVVIPARWFGGGKGLQEFRDLMINSPHLKSIKYFKNAAHVFPTVDINGGVCFLYLDKSFVGATTFTDGEHANEVVLSEFDIIPDDPLAFSIIRKIQNKWKKKYLGEVAWPRNAFGLTTDHFNKNKEVDSKSKEAIACLSRNRKIKFTQLKFIKKNQKVINLWKVCVPNAAGGSKGNRRSTIPLNQIILVKPGVVVTDTYNIIECFDNKNEAENLITYLKTDFSRYLLGLRKITQHIPRDRWNWVPHMETNREWTDQKLFEYFNLNQEERTHVMRKVQEWS